SQVADNFSNFNMQNVTDLELAANQYQLFTGANIQPVLSSVSDALADTIAVLFSKVGTFAFFDTKIGKSKE
ncbi:18245_t:CDS:2, partial [Gigaspora margarita]